MKSRINKPESGIVIILITVSCFLTKCSSSNRTTATSANENIIKAIDSSAWMFTPQQMRPLTGRAKSVTGNYSVILGNQKLSVYLPYFGSAQAGADVFSNRGPLDFTSTDFTVDKQLAKEGEWRINKKPKDQREVQSLYFDVFSNGAASLNVTLTNHTPISFNGTVKAVK
jgi:hypothetical protein